MRLISPALVVSTAIQARHVNSSAPVDSAMTEANPLASAHPPDVGYDGVPAGRVRNPDDPTTEERTPGESFMEAINFKIFKLVQEAQGRILGLPEQPRGDMEWLERYGQDAILHYLETGDKDPSQLEKKYDQLLDELKNAPNLEVEILESIHALFLAYMEEVAKPAVQTTPKLNEQPDKFAWAMINKARRNAKPGIRNPYKSLNIPLVENYIKKYNAFIELRQRELTLLDTFSCAFNHNTVKLAKFLAMVDTFSPKRTFVLAMRIELSEIWIEEKRTIAEVASILGISTITGYAKNRLSAGTFVRFIYQLAKTNEQLGPDIVKDLVKTFGPDRTTELLTRMKTVSPRMFTILKDHMDVRLKETGVTPN
uniref:Avirulence protein ATR5 n=1 Tax=Hyaloperonospora arabidopsidis (strain Emoy2) TaxID=559515 RepID=ATR5_HYAAE|nr:RecName: Full=Avirulence protein ATR5; AltName: Full=Arabidopsis thaliana recognized protein 5; Flags: Precursor [Hyaloperonospora arabidopsidis Emoy2]CBI63251.1 ATR5 protein [Hyaloperonospora arabidopsidis]